MELLLILELLLGTVPLLPQLVVLLVPVSEGLAKWSIAEVQECIAREIDVQFCPPPRDCSGLPRCYASDSAPVSNVT